MPSKRGRSGGGGASAAAASSSSSTFTPLTDLVPASIPFTDQARRVLESLRSGQEDPGLDALLQALNCGGACEAAAAPYSTKCGCRAAFAAGGKAGGAGGAGGGAAPRCVRGLAPPPGSHRKIGLWAKPRKEEEEEKAKEGGEKEEEEEEEVRRRTRERGLFFFFFVFKVKKKNSIKKTH